MVIIIIMMIIPSFFKIQWKICPAVGEVQNLITTVHTVSGVTLTFRINYFHLISFRQRDFLLDPVHYSVSRGLLVLLSLEIITISLQLRPHLQD